MSDIFKNYKSLLSVFSILFLTNFIFADPTDGCELGANELFVTQSGDVLYNSAADIGGFQWTVDGATVTATSGGDAAAAGFTVQAAGTTVLGFSFTGGVVPAGCGTLTQMTLSGEATGLSGIVFSDASGNALDFSYYVPSDDTGGDDGGDGGVADACDLPSNTIYLDGGDVWYNVDTDIGGFQWTVDGSTVTATSGGDAAAAGFTVQAAGTTVLGFSFTGGTVPAGC